MRDRPPGAAILAFTVLLLCACTRGADRALLPRLKSALAERDRKLTSYRFSAEAHQGDAVARHTFAFRSPNKMRGEVLEPGHLLVAFDGTTLTEARPDEKKLVLHPLELAPAKASIFLHDTFAPFVFEGYRAPLLPNGATAKSGEGKVEVTATLSDEGKPVEVRYLFKWPSADFVARESKVDGVESSLHVDQEQCDARLAFCVPTKVSQRSGGQLIGTTVISNIELNPELPNDGFTLHPGDGWTTETHEVFDAP